ncbi:MAG: SGNH/GDSL hydrolase family protein [Oscillospiraceae bacterium]|jgi:lysophospholipase L1-like esterase|nr:SGNH/GDSL hydrolase family protein [Oscillospiraceae bacterium]
MKLIHKIEVFGDSILKGVQLNPQSGRYCVDNNIDVDMLSRRFSLNIVNRSKFGCTVKKGKDMLYKYLGGKPDCAAVLMNYGGNDCDFNWKAISDDPGAKHEPHTPIREFLKTYKDMLKQVYDRGIRPVVTNLPPLEPQRFFDWFCSGLNKENVLRWLDGVNSIYRYQEFYSHAIENLARTTGVMLVDLRGAFLRETRIGRFLCEDGIHPNTEGQRLITQELERFCAAALV